MQSSNLKVVVLEGKSFRERGRIHGETLREMIIEHQQRWQDDLEASTGMDPSRYLEQLYSETNFMPAIERWTPQLLEEVEGIAEGSGVDLRYILARQLSDEEPWYRREKKLAMTGGRGCTSIGVDARAGSAAIIGQNMDCPTWYYGHHVLFHHKGPDLPAEVFNLSLAGKINLCGMNSKGLSICCNTLSQLDYSHEGLPEDFVVRGFLHQTSLERGLAFLRDIKHASGQNYTVAEPGSRAINLEISANKIAEYRPWPEADRVYHTNHPLVNDDQGIRRAQLDAGLEIPGSTSTLPRFEDLHKRFGNEGSPVTLETMKAAFSSHDGTICRHPQDGGGTTTLGCLIMELTQPPALHIAPGPPCETPFQTYRFV
ncbi:hypothetical protein HBA55_23005 [Pseudomaricurvus alkylphenolicus]|uniref:C45 family autoproteolytic acyltransferase/hydolase n=1 Tax=Pseudomaricurvus alkylphenolicus TaxID=1306991 RepID=UPI00141DF3FD|nr:C45 family peptidase [Pseudomaricurvus alkylphenolicus]NIB42495.1 hypothetical protein [Pseudomaricurvus alkylphenolicus]